MEKQIVLREPIEWKEEGGLHFGYVGDAKMFMIAPGAKNWAIMSPIGTPVREYVDFGELQAKAESLLTDWLNSIAQPEDILTVKETKQ